MTVLRATRPIKTVVSIDLKRSFDSTSSDMERNLVLHPGGQERKLSPKTLTN